MFRFALKGFVCALVLAGLPAITACGSAGQPKQQESGELGKVSVALVAKGADGSTYNFQSGTSLCIFGNDFGQCNPLDANENVMTFDAPPGGYIAVFSPSTPTSLNKIVNGVPSAVNATLLNTDLTFNIVANQTTNLDLRFNVAGLNDITFSTGRLLVTLSVAQSSGDDPGSASISGTTTISSQDFDASATAAQQSLLGVNVGDTFSAGFVFTPSAPWFLGGPAQTCVRGTITSVSFPAVGTPFGNRMSEELSAPGFVCIFDNGPGANDTVNLQGFGNATPADQQSVLPSTYLFELSVSGLLPFDVFDGKTLKQSELTAVNNVSNGFFFHSVTDETAGVTITQMQGDFSGQFQLSP